MKILMRLVLASLAAAALTATGPAVLAGAAPALHTKSTAVTAGADGLAVAIPMTRVAHAFSKTLPMTSQSQATLARSAHFNLVASSAPEIQVRVGTNNCAGFNGQWVAQVIGMVQGLPLWGYQFYGIEWDDCYYGYPASTAYTYVKWTASGITSNTQLQPPAGAGQSVGINQTIPTGIETMSDVYVTACLKWYTFLQQLQWSCGYSQHL